MASLRMRLALIILGLLFPLPHSFVIRKRSIGYDFLDNKAVPSEEWLMERPVDDLRDPYGDGRYAGLDDERLALDLLLPRPEDDYVEDELEDEETGLDRINLVPVREEDEDEVDEDEATNGGAKLVDKSELENLFEKSSDLKMKKTSKGMEVEDGSETSTKSELTKEDVEKLLNPKQNMEMRKEVKETQIVVGSSNGSNAAPSYEGVRVIELAEKDPSGATRRQKQTQWLVSPDKEGEKTGEGGSAGTALDGGEITRSWLGDVLDEAQKEEEEEEDSRRVTRKVKRSELSTNEEYMGEDGTSPEANHEDVELLKAYIRLQTEENRHLEKALNLAISTQVENTDEYLGEEVGQLRMAVENEEALETIRNAIRGRQNKNEEEEEEEEEEEGEVDGEVGEGEQIDNGEDEEEDEFSRQLLKAKLKKFLIDSAVKDIKENGYDNELVDDLEKDEADQRRQVHYPHSSAKVLNPFTRNTFPDYRMMKRNTGYDESAQDIDRDAMLRATNDLDIADLLDSPPSTESEYCPAVRELTDGCLAARKEGLILDAEAVSLCNRHQICYFCGSVFGMTSDSCDRGYLAESEDLCSGQEKCTKEAAGLYLIMAKAHQFIPSPEFTPYVCAAECVYDYVIGEADDQR